MMKKQIVSIIVLIACTVSLFAQITQKQADEIVMERLRGETRSYTLYADRRTQENTTISTSSGETIELSYPVRVYYIRYADASSGYLVVKESTGNLLEIKAKNDSGPLDLPIWEVVLPKEIPFTEYSLEGTSCQWKELSKGRCNYSQLAMINSNEELEKYVYCTTGTYPEIDFSKYTLLFANGVRCYFDHHNYTDLQQISKQNYVLKVNFQESASAALREWQVGIIVSKLEAGINVILEGGNVEFKNE